jgi:adenosylcobinamide-phosphate synthase
MDSMGGFKSALYFRFGWCGARADDAMNYLPACMTSMLIVMASAFVPDGSARKAWSAAIKQHRALPSPNFGWSEDAMAGAIQRRLVGPIWKNGQLVTETWLGDPQDPPAATRSDIQRAAAVTLLGGLAAFALAEFILLLRP